MNWILKLFSSRPNGPMQGEWEGYYEQDESRHRLQATIEHRGTRLNGTMYDLDVVIDIPLDQLMDRNDWTHQEKLDFENEIRTMLPDAEKNAPIIFRSILPQHSSLSGTAVDTEVQFTKTYHGDIRYEYLIGDRYVEGTPEPCLPINYSAIIECDQDVLVGQWVIRDDNDPINEQEPHEFSGRFELRRRKSEITFQ